MFLDQLSAPAEWKNLPDETLTVRYWEMCRSAPQDEQAQLIICLLMKRYKNAIFLLSQPFLKTEPEFEEFTHELFLMLVDRLKHLRVEKQFPKFLFTIVRIMHLDQVHPRKR